MQLILNHKICQYRVFLFLCKILYRVGTFRFCSGLLSFYGQLAFPEIDDNQVWEETLPYLKNNVIALEIVMAESTIMNVLQGIHNVTKKNFPFPFRNNFFFRGGLEYDRTFSSLTVKLQHNIG